MKPFNTNNAPDLQGLKIEVLVQNERVVVCKVTGNSFGPVYLHYHAATGWRDLDTGETNLSLQMHSIVANPFALR